MQIFTHRQELTVIEQTFGSYKKKTYEQNLYQNMRVNQSLVETYQSTP